MALTHSWVTFCSILADLPHVFGLLFTRFEATFDTSDSYRLAIAEVLIFRYAVILSFNFGDGLAINDDFTLEGSSLNTHFILIVGSVLDVDVRLRHLMRS